MTDEAARIARYLVDEILETSNTVLASRNVPQIVARFERMLDVFPHASEDEIIRGARIAAELLDARAAELEFESKQKSPKGLS